MCWIGSAKEDINSAFIGEKGVWYLKEEVSDYCELSKKFNLFNLKLQIKKYDRKEH